MAGPNWKNWKLLIVDGDKEFLDHATAILKKVGMGEVRSTESPQSAMEMLDSYPADAALIGIQLKGTSGVEFVSRLRNPRTSPKPTLPIIMVISAADPKALLNACRIGIENFIRKPLDDDVLCKRVASTIQNPRRFVVTREYFGPERRRRTVPVEHERRRGAKAAVARPVRRPSDDREDIPLVDAPPTVKSEPPAAAPPVAPPPLSQPAPSIPALKETAPTPTKAAPPAQVPLVETPPPPAEPVPSVDVPLVEEPVPTAEKPAATADWHAALEPKVEEPAGVEADGLQLDQEILGEGKRASFANEDLHGADMHGLVLSNASFNGADLSDSNCEGADLSSADLRRAVMSNANIKGGKLGVAQMRHSVLDRAILEGAILRGAYLAGANLEGANLKDADFSGAILLSTNLSGADLSGATGLTQAQLDRCMGNMETILPAGLRISNPDG
jgi:CheY-like chemotaxis protein